MLANNLLSFLIWFPVAGGALLLLIGDGDDTESAQARLMRMTALAFSGIASWMPVAQATRPPAI